MTPTLDQLISSVEAMTTNPLEQLAAASVVAREFERLSDGLVTHFVEHCRSRRMPWTDIGEQLGVSRQAVQKRFADEDRPSDDARADRRRQEHFGKYRPLWEWLREQASDSFEASFSDIERVLGFTLPPSSRKHQPHWHSYDGSAVVRAIVDAGWRAKRVDLANESVTFSRT